MQNFGYLIGDEKTKQAFIVDPAWSPAKILSIVEKEGFKLAGLLVSHAHFDHTNAIEDLLALVDVPVYAQADEVPYAKSGNKIVGNLGSTLKPIDGEQTLKLGETEVKFLHTPGHTPGSQCIIVGDNLITGDTLFIGGCGRSDMPGGNPSLLFDSLKKIASLPSNLQICPGHDYGNVRQKLLGNEVKDNPYLGLKEKHQFIEAVS